MAEALGTAATAISVIQYFSIHLSVVAEKYNRLKARVAEYGLFVTFLLHIVFSDALRVMDRVERHVLVVDDAQVVAFLDSYISGFNMIGVAGAIIAQIATSAISLTRLEDSHWAVEALFVASLVTGCLSVFFSCAIGPAFHGLHTASHIKDFLTKPTSAAEASEFNKQMDRAERHRALFKAADELRIAEMACMLEMQKWKVASAYAAILLVVPRTLLSLALTAFLAGLGVYLGMVYTADLVPAYGRGSVGILIFYLVSAILGVGMYYSANSLKYFESTPLLRFQKIAETSRLRSSIGKLRGEEPRLADGDGGFAQSRHLRQGGRLQYTDGIPNVVIEDLAHENEHHKEEKVTLAEDISVNDHDHQPVLTASVAKQRCSVDEWNLRKASAASSSQEASDAVPMPENAESVRIILQDLLRVHEESLRINRRLLEALGITSPPD